MVPLSFSDTGESRQRSIGKANAKDIPTPLLGADSERRTAYSLVEASPAATASPSEGPAVENDASSKHTGNSSPPLPFIQQLHPHDTHTQLIGYLGSAPWPIWSNRKASPPISPGNVFMAKYPIFPLSNR